jgi:hypothetical protein
MDDMKQQGRERSEQGGHEPHSRPEPVPEVQAEYLRKLAEEAGEPSVELESQADACRRLRELQRKVGREPHVLENDHTDG